MKDILLRCYVVAAGLMAFTGLVIAYRMFSGSQFKSREKITTNNTWAPPDTNGLAGTEAANLIRYGRALIVNTAAYLGPKGLVARMSNGMNCQNCHLDAGTRLFGSNYALVASSYPKYRDRSGRIESIEFRINECMERSLNGKKLDSLSHEMQAMVAYLKWVGKAVKKDSRLQGTGMPDMPWLERSANADNGQRIYAAKCKICHGPKGEGMPLPDSAGYIYPPLWGANSYNVSAGMYRISKLASFVKHNMPFKAAAVAPELTDEDAWDVAAFVNSMPRPEKFFRYDWPDINTKPVDYPFGPYADSYTALQHKLGPFGPIKKINGLAQKKPLQKKAT